MTKTTKGLGLAVATALVLAAATAAIGALGRQPSVRALIGAAQDVAEAAVYAAQDPAGGPGAFGGPGRGPGRFGGPGGPPMGGPGAVGIALERLGLSDTQKEQVRSITKSHQEDTKGLADREMAARTALEDAVSADSLDEGAIRSKSAELAAIEADMAVMRSRIRFEILQVLTPEQQAQVKQMQAQMKQRQEQMRQRRPPRPPQ